MHVTYQNRWFCLIGAHQIWLSELGQITDPTGRDSNGLGFRPNPIGRSYNGGATET